MTARATSASIDPYSRIERELRNRAQVRVWLYFICFLVFCMVLVGGATRLTDSGLSITEWKPITGTIPPLTSQQWEVELEKYRQIPEYQQINKGMSMSEFQFIYWWEWGHRFLGRLIGLAFAIPFAFFWLTGRLENQLKPKLLFLFALGGLQGFVGWWMVKSGLVDRVDVSQYRLATHLTLACIIFAYAMWIARGLAPHSGEVSDYGLRNFAPVVTVAILIQIFMGGLVAGLDAGLASNEWPLMIGEWVPPGLWDYSPPWINAFENPLAVQFNHRISGYILFTLVLLQFLAALASPSGATHKRRTFVLVVLCLFQMAFGVFTVWYEVPMSWALAHQGGAVVLLGFSVAHWRAFKGEFKRPTGVVRGDKVELGSPMTA